MAETTPGVRFPLDGEVTATWIQDSRDLRIYLLIKRLIDIVISACALCLLAPFLLLVALAIKLHSPGPAIFCQERVGFDPHTHTVRRFKLYKFRSMRVNTDDAIHRSHVVRLIQENSSVSSDNGSLKLARDPRITGLGQLLRKSSLDELPQLFNVLKGDMSLVGPRPALPYEVALYRERHLPRLQAVPGITGWWQVKGRCRVSFDDAVAMDIWYIEHRSLALDLQILLLTPWAVITGKGAG